MYDTTFDALLPMLLRLESVTQDPRFHPEGSALYHSLQVAALARRDCASPTLLAAALLHDIGKALPGTDHAASGADALESIARPEVTWLVAHHLDLLRAPAETRAHLRGDPRLDDLERLRTWDLAGRQRNVWVEDPERALGALFAPEIADAWLAEHLVAEDAY